MKRILLSLIFASALYSCGSQQTAVQPLEPAVINPPNPPVAVNPVKTEPSPENAVKGKEIYDNSCSRCHKLFSPKDFSANDWEPILQRMQPKAKLTDMDMVMIHDYIYSNL